MIFSLILPDSGRLSAMFQNSTELFFSDPQYYYEPQYSLDFISENGRNSSWQKLDDLVSSNIMDGTVYHCYLLLVVVIFN